VPGIAWPSSLEVNPDRPQDSDRRIWEDLLGDPLNALYGSDPFPTDHRRRHLCNFGRRGKLDLPTQPVQTTLTVRISTSKECQIHRARTAAHLEGIRHYNRDEKETSSRG